MRRIKTRDITLSAGRFPRVAVCMFREAKYAQQASIFLNGKGCGTAMHCISRPTPRIGDHQLARQADTKHPQANALIQNSL
jgi:hypothetical protein